MNLICNAGGVHVVVTQDVLLMSCKTWSTDRGHWTTTTTMMTKNNKKKKTGRERDKEGGREGRKTEC